MLFPAWITQDYDGILPGKIKFYFDMILGVRFAIRGISYGRRLGPALSLILGQTDTLMTSQGSDTVTSIFKCNSSNTIKSLRQLKMA